MKIKKSKSSRKANKSIKRIAKISASSTVTRGVGRPRIEIPLPQPGRNFSVNTLLGLVSRRKNPCTRMTLLNFCNRLLRSRKIKMVAPASNGTRLRVFQVIDRGSKKSAQTTRSTRTVKPNEKNAVRQSNAAVLAA